MKLIPHFTFDGHAEEALNFYASVFNGKIESLLRFKDFQAEIPGGMNENEMDKLVYSSVSIGDGYQIDMCDYASEEKKCDGSCVFIDLIYTDIPELQRIYNALSADGQILMPLGKTSWSENFASVIDRFGIGWNLMQEE